MHSIPRLLYYESVGERSPWRSIVSAPRAPLPCSIHPDPSHMAISSTSHRLTTSTDTAAVPDALLAPHMDVRVAG